jgi:hypothetical protein
MNRWRIRYERLFLMVMLGITLSSLGVLAQTVGWPQWGQNPQHSGTVTVAGQNLTNIDADVTYDPFVPQEQAANGGELLAHYQAPLVDGSDVYMEVETGSYEPNNPNSRTWNEEKFTWSGGQLVSVWNFASDWRPVNPATLGGWEPVFHAALSGNFVYVPGEDGSVSKLNKSDGSLVAHFSFPGSNGNTFVMGPLTADSGGNIYYNAAEFKDASNIFGDDVVNAWLVRIGADGTVTTATFASLVPNPGTTCLGVFTTQPLPWPPSATATPPTVACGSQRPGFNVAPAISPDGGTLYTVSRAQFSSRNSYLVAVNLPSLTPKWHSSFQGLLNDGCNNDTGTFPGSVLPANGQPGGCRLGSTPGVDPAQNVRPAARVIDQSSSSPVVSPDGTFVLYGSYTRYNFARGHLVKFSASDGSFQAEYEFGWDSTPPITTDSASTVIKDNHYDVGSYCNDPTFCPVAPKGPYFMTQLSTANGPVVSGVTTLSPQWKFQNTSTDATHNNGFEWCINATAIDSNKVVYANSEDGSIYAILQGGALRDSHFLRQAIGAAYTPLSIAADGKIYTENDGHLFVLSNR